MGVIMTNKALLTQFSFRHPFLLTLLHMISCTTFCSILMATRLVPMEYCKTRAQFIKICCLSAVFCTTVVLGNVSLRFIPVSFNQAISATAPAFTALLTFIIQGTVESVATYATLLPVVGGIVLSSRFEPMFHVIGFAACLAGTALRALKSVLQVRPPLSSCCPLARWCHPFAFSPHLAAHEATQSAAVKCNCEVFFFGLSHSVAAAIKKHCMQAILLSDGEKLSSIALLAYMAPISALFLVPLTIYFEPDSGLSAIDKISTSGAFTAFLVLNCCLAFFVNLTNFLVTKHCGALTLQVLGNAKGVIAAIISVLIFHNPVSVLSWLGYGITMVGVVAYSESRKRSNKRNEATDAEAVPLKAQEAGMGVWGPRSASAGTPVGRRPASVASPVDRGE